MIQVKQPIDYFNHAYQGREQFFNLPSNTTTQPAQYCLDMEYNIDGVDYKNILTTNLGFSSAFGRRLDKYIRFYDVYTLADLSKLPDDLTQFRYYDNNNMQIVNTNNNVNFTFKEIDKPRLINTYTGRLNKVMIKAKRFKDVFDYSKITSNIKTVSGKTYTPTEFFDLFKDYLVPVNEDGNYIDYDYTPLVDVSTGIELFPGRKNTRPYIAIPIDENNTPLYPIMTSQSYYQFGGSRKAYLGDEVGSRNSMFQDFTPFTVLNNNNNFKYMTIRSDALVETDMWGKMAKIADGAATYIDIVDYGYDYKINYHEENLINTNRAVEFTFPNTTMQWSGGVLTPQTVNITKTIIDNGLYYENDLTLFDRCFVFNYNNPNPENRNNSNQTLQYTMFNKRDLEEYFKAFNVDFVYMFEMEDDEFVQGRKVRHPSLINQPATLNFSKERHNSLINQPAIQAVKKVRHIL